MEFHQASFHATSIMARRTELILQNLPLNYGIFFLVRPKVVDLLNLRLKQGDKLMFF